MIAEACRVAHATMIPIARAQRLWLRRGVAMPSEKAKENKKLVASCAACGKTLSTELLTGLVVGVPPKRQLVAVCQPCLDAGWVPPPAEAGFSTS